MAVKAQGSITVAVLTAVSSSTRYYLLQSSTLSTPAKPTANPPGGTWSSTEPTYSSGSTNSLYTCDLTVFSDDTYSYSAVSLSSSYEAAKAAYNKAAALAQTLVASVDVEYALGDTSTTAPTGGWSTDSPVWTQGKYIWQRTKSVDGSGAESYSEPTCIQGAKGDPGAKGDTGVGVSEIVDEYYLSTSPTAQSGGSWGTSQPAWAESHYIWTRSKVTWTSGSVTYTQPVLAKAINSANEVASKTTWHFWADSEGAHVATSEQDATTGANILLTGEGINIRRGTNVLASFLASVCELGEDSADAIIKMCGGKGSIRQHNQLIMAGDSGTVLQSTDGVENGTDFGIGISRSSAGVETAMVSGDDVVISGFVDRYTSAESTYANEITWRVLPFAGLNLAFGTGTWKSFTLSDSFNQTWYKQVVFPVPSGVFISKPLGGIGSSGGLYALSVSAYASWTATSVRFDVSKNYQGNPIGETFGIVLWGV